MSVLVAGLLGLAAAAGGWLVGVPNLIAAGLAVAGVAAVCAARDAAQASGATARVPGACGAARTTQPDVEPSAGRSTGERTERMEGSARVRAAHPHDSKRPPATPSTRAGGHPTPGEYL